MAKIKLLEEVNDRVALAQARIEAAVAAIQSGANWLNYLKLQSSLHRYSAGNVWLIASQHAAAFERGLVELRGLEPLTPSLRTHRIAVTQACMSSHLCARRHRGAVEGDRVAVPNCCTSRPCELRSVQSRTVFNLARGLVNEHPLTAGCKSAHRAAGPRPVPGWIRGRIRCGSRWTSQYSSLGLLSRR